MQIIGNTILITAGGSGIGRGSAEAFHGLGNQVIITGCRQATLENVTAANPGMRAVRLDMDDAYAIREFALEAAASLPDPERPGRQRRYSAPEDLRTQDEDLAAMEAMVTTNLLGPIRLTAALLALLRRQLRSTVINVTSPGGATDAAVGAADPSSKRWWRDNDIHSYGEGVKQIRHAVLGPLEFEYSAFAVDGRPDLSMVVYNPTTPADADRIRLLIESAPALERAGSSRSIFLIQICGFPKIAGLIAFIPMPASPIYSAAKAALHASFAPDRTPDKRTSCLVHETVNPSSSSDLQERSRHPACPPRSGRWAMPMFAPSFIH